MRVESEIELKKTQDELNQVLKELNKVETEYKEFVSNTQLEAAEKNRLMSDHASIFTSLELSQIIRHELKNNFNKLYVSLQDLQASTDIGASKSSKIILYDITNEMQNIQSNLNSWTKISNVNSLENAPEKLELRSVIKENISMLGNGLNKKSTRININWPINSDKKLYFSGVKSEINTVFLNLLINSCQHSPDKSKITINVSENANYLITEISNPSIPHRYNDLNDLFKAGYTLSKEGASGFGLFVSKRIIEATGGEISLAHTENTFIVSVKMKKWLTQQSR